MTAPETEKARMGLEEAVKPDFKAELECRALFDEMLRVTVRVQHGDVGDSPAGYKARFDAICAKARAWQIQNPRFKVVVTMFVLSETSVVMEAFQNTYPS